MKFSLYGLTAEGGSEAECRLRIEATAISMGGTAETKLYQHYLNLHKVLWPEDPQHRWFVLGMKSMVENKVTVFLGCASCVAGDTRILNPLTGEQPTIRELYERKTCPTVLTLAGPAKASTPFIKGTDHLFEVVLENGERFKATSSHRVLAIGGDFCRVSNLRCGDLIVSNAENLRQRTSELYPSIRGLDETCFQKTVEDLRENYFSYFHPCGERPPSKEETCLSFFPYLNDVQEHKETACDGVDGLDYKQTHNLFYQSIFRPSKHNDFPPFLKLENRALPHSFSKTFLHDDPRFQSVGQSQQDSLRRHTFSKPNHGFDCTRSLYEVLFSNSHAYDSKVSHSRVVSIRKTKKEEFFDLCVPNFHHYYAEGAIHHNSGKSYCMAAHALIEFFVFPQTSLALISSTEIRSLEIKVWGRGVKSLFNRAKRRFPLLPGYVLESKLCITPDEVDDEGELGRELNKGIICVPCVSGGRFVGMGKFQGAKPPNSPGKNDGLLRHYGDEAALMQPSFLDAYTNWMSNRNFKGAMGGNPTDISDPLCIAAEPVGGWDAFIDDGKTQEWTSKFYNAHVIAFDGRDTPNNDEPKDRYHFLASSSFIKELEETHGSDSWQLFQQGIGKPSKNMVSWRVITIGLCERHKAFDDVVWMGTPLTSIYALDPAYGGGDRCVYGECKFGKDKEGNIIFAVGRPEILPIRLNSALEPEEQIAGHLKNQSESLGIPPQHMFYDSFGRGTLGFSFAKVFGSNCPVPVDSGARPTERPVRFDLYVEENGSKRLKRCDEHYSKFVTEMWFSTREAIESEQVRCLPKSVALEGQCRLYKIVMGNKIEVEPKDDMKERIRKSPDLYDWFAVAIEGARRLGFQIKRIGSNVSPGVKDDSGRWMKKLADERRDWTKRQTAIHG